MITRVALIGATGHGASHLTRLTQADQDGRLRLVGVADLRPVPTPTRQFRDHRELLAATEPDVVVVCTPPHTHLPIALDVLQAGADLLLEKPPVLSLAEHAELSQAVTATGRVCQVGFQALGSRALAGLLDAVRADRLGAITAIAAAGAWWRPDSYFSRVPWAGRRSLDGRPVLDGALANPFAHALANCLAIAEAAGAGAPIDLSVERYRVLDIEVEDTASLRLELDDGPPIVIAVSLRSAQFVAGEITVTGTGGQALFEYPTDRLALASGDDLRAVPGRVDLLDNLLAHRAEPDRVALLAPLAATGAFTAVVEALGRAPVPARIAPAHLHTHEDGAAIAGVAQLVRRAAGALSLFSELGTAWAVPAYHTEEVPHAQVDAA